MHVICNEYSKQNRIVINIIKFHKLCYHPIRDKSLEIDTFGTWPKSFSVFESDYLCLILFYTAFVLHNNNFT